MRTRLPVSSLVQHFADLYLSPQLVVGVWGCFSECLAECANLLKWHRLSVSLAGGMEEEWTVHQLGSLGSRLHLSVTLLPAIAPSVFYSGFICTN